MDGYLYIVTTLAARRRGKFYGAWEDLLHKALYLATTDSLLKCYDQNDHMKLLD
jgi:hypothetical protein